YESTPTARPPLAVRTCTRTDPSPRGGQDPRPRGDPADSPQRDQASRPVPRRRPLALPPRSRLAMRTETFHTPGDLRLNLELPAGKIEIESADTEDTHVELEAVSSNEQVREMVENARIEEVR